jgi:hypothetical protein
MNEFVIELQSILDRYYMAPNGIPVKMMGNPVYIKFVKEKYIKEANPKIDQLVEKMSVFGIFTREVISGVVSDVFFSYFKEDI